MGYLHEMHQSLLCSVIVGGLVACSTQSPESSPNTSKPKALYATFHYEVGIYPAVETATISRGGKVLGKIGPGKGYVGLDYDSEKSVLTVNDLEAELATTCGTVRVPLGLRVTGDDLTTITGNGRDMTFEPLEAIGTAVVQLWIDNVGNPATAVTVGQQTIPVAADATWVGKVRVGPCATARDVKIDGAVAGKLPAIADEQIHLGKRMVPMPKQLHVLIDAKGGHCYRQRQLIYADQAVKADRKPDRTLRGGRVYEVDRPQDFLKSAPSRINVTVPDDQRDLAEVRSRVELDRCK